ncbi:cell wall hydrolase [Lichenihabitans sp. PAMC28606]|uniref:cell wall hydrolase n=1 Tax=Lichenihabitans sp. PAMC28606 TaxID=2880932 RepID=UPI0039B46AF7
MSLIGLAVSLGGCGLSPMGGLQLSDRECLTRAMYFESNRSSPDGMLAVGTTVMNRVAAPGYPKTVCGVVGQRNQYAEGVLSKPMSPRERDRIAQVADAVLAGQRHPQVGSAMFFHTAGLTFPYTNMHYVAVAGGNAFYEKRAPERGGPIGYAGFQQPTTLLAMNAEPARAADPFKATSHVGGDAPTLDAPVHRATRLAVATPMTIAPPMSIVAVARSPNSRPNEAKPRSIDDLLLTSTQSAAVRGFNPS